MDGNNYGLSLSSLIFNIMIENNEIGDEPHNSAVEMKPKQSLICFNKNESKPTT